MVQKSTMKWGVILILSILFSPYVLGTDATLGLGENYLYNGANITFTKLDYKDNKVVLCINNQKQILEEDQLAYFANRSGSNFIEIEVDHIDIKDRTIDIDIGWTEVCEDVYCECIDDCLNDECKIQMFDQWGSPLNKEPEEEVEENITQPVVKTEKTKIPNYILIISLVIIGSFLGLFLVWLFWFGQVTF